MSEITETCHFHSEYRLESESRLNCFNIQRCNPALPVSPTILKLPLNLSLLSASSDLHTAFQDLVSTPSQRGLLVTISNESLLPLQTLTSSSPSFLDDLSLLTPHLKSTTPLYILLRLYAERADGFVAITYVPDAAPVRQKTLFASTRLALVRELGPERFCESLFVTERAELEPDGWERYERSRGVEAPLTGEEQVLKSVKEAEAEERGGMEGRRLEVGGRIKVGMESEVKAALEGLTVGGDNLVQLVGWVLVGIREEG